MAYILYATAPPFGTKTGDLRSGPPPTGRITGFRAVRELTGTEGYRRRAMDFFCLLEQASKKRGTDCLTFFEHILEVLHLPKPRSRNLRAARQCVGDLLP